MVKYLCIMKRDEVLGGNNVGGYSCSQTTAAHEEKDMMSTLGCVESAVLLHSDCRSVLSTLAIPTLSTNYYWRLRNTL